MMNPRQSTSSLTWRRPSPRIGARMRTHPTVTISTSCMPTSPSSTSSEGKYRIFKLLLNIKKIELPLNIQKVKLLLNIQKIKLLLNIQKVKLLLNIQKVKLLLNIQKVKLLLNIHRVYSLFHI